MDYKGSVSIWPYKDQIILSILTTKMLNIGRQISPKFFRNKKERYASFNGRQISYFYDDNVAKLNCFKRDGKITRVSPDIRLNLP